MMDTDGQYASNPVFRNSSKMLTILVEDASLSLFIKLVIVCLLR